MNHGAHRVGFTLSLLFFIPFLIYLHSTYLGYILLIVGYFLADPDKDDPDKESHFKFTQHRNMLTHSLHFPLLWYLLLFTIPLGRFILVEVLAMCSATIIHLLLDLKLKKMRKCGNYRISAFGYKMSCIASFFYLLANILIYITLAWYILLKRM